MRGRGRQFPRTITNGTRHGRLVMVSDAGYNDKRNRLIRVRCDCGTEKVITSMQLRQTESCGCYVKESHYRPHGMSKSPTWVSWNGMKMRCQRPTAVDYARYGGRGIKVCERWLKFSNFLADMGIRPSLKHSLDRIDNNGDYEPSNCRWVTRDVQSRNMRNNRFYTYQGERLIIGDWAQRVGIKRGTLAARLDRGWSIEKSLLTPVMPK